MKELNNSTIIIALATLVIGLGLGWVFFSNGSESDYNEHQHATENTIDEWTCSMHPQIRQKEPGDCPICGMDLVPVGSDNDGEENPLEIKMSPTAMQLANVQTELVSKTLPVKELRLTGKVQADERAITSQTTHISGRIEKLLVNTTGEYISKGQTIAYIYSPELVTAQEELFEAKKIAESNPQLFQAAKEKLKNWKLTNQQISAILASGKPSENFPILSDRNGIILNKRVNLGDHVMQGASLFEVANLSNVWILFDVYESDMSWIKVGDEISYSVQSIPGKEFSGKVSFIDPVINPKTRVAQARIVSKNKNSELKPEMFVTGIVNSPIEAQEKSIIIPKSAVMWTGKKSVVYVKTSDNKGVGFTMRKITTGASLGESMVVLEGLTEGEEIATHGTFSIDAAAQLAGKPSMMNPQGGTVMTGHNHGGMQTDSGSEELMMNHVKVNISEEMYDVSDEFKNQIKSVYESYLHVKDAMISSDAKLANEKAKTLQKAIDNVNMRLVKGDAHIVWMKDLEILNSTSEMITNELSIEKARNMLSPLSDQLYQTLKKFKVETNGFRQFCPMAFDNKGAFWLSDSKEVLNPYFGDAMLTCGRVEEEL